ncbi:unnamed protein product [Hyaloperonospora brassicae]|uniref:FAR1 domain-containing protein n=1 Tax=Hyaloperonospora brassicae TaxID=162125 RepID=A0AAV0UJ61_HYABA|nr:unnamed protein product [Hyaloperonospora brassicae]
MSTKRRCASPCATEDEDPVKRARRDTDGTGSDSHNMSLQPYQSCGDDPVQAPSYLATAAHVEPITAENNVATDEGSTVAEGQEGTEVKDGTVQSDAVLSGALELSNGVATSSLGLLVVAPDFPVLHDSWERFDEALKAYGKATYQLYVIRSTTSVKRRNLKIAESGAREHMAATCDVEPETELGTPVVQDVPDVEKPQVVEKTLIPERFLWYSKSLKCTHGWKDRHRGTGKRGSGVVRSTSCSAKMCVTLQHRGPGPNDWKVVVTKHMQTHNHQLSKELYLYYTENRRIYDPDLLAVVGKTPGATPSSYDMVTAHIASLIEQTNQRPGSYRVLLSHTEQKQRHASLMASDSPTPLFSFPNENASDGSASKQLMALSETGAVDQPRLQMRTSPVAMAPLGATVLTPGTVPSIAIDGGGFCVPRVSVKVHASWNDFHDFIAQYSFDTAQTFRTRSTVSVAARNAKILSSDAAKSGRDEHDVASYASYATTSSSLRLIPKEYKWFSKLLICTYGWKRKARDKRSRGLVDESNDAGPCPAMLLARMERNVDGDWHIAINRQVQKHNHRLSGYIQKTSGSSSVPVQCAKNDAAEPFATAPLMNSSSAQRSSSTNSSSLLQAQAMAKLGVGHPPLRPQNHREIVVRVPKLQSIFTSWDEFHASLKAYSDATYQLYRTRTTSSAKGRNKKIARSTCGSGDDGKGKKYDNESDSDVTLNGSVIARKIPESWRWYSKTLTCTHGWKERHRGTGKRSAHGVRSTACPVKICATVQYMNPSARIHVESISDSVDASDLVTSDCHWRVVVTKHVVDHNHNLSRELYQHYCENRRIYDPELLAIDTSNTNMEVDSMVYQGSATAASDTLKPCIIDSQTCYRPQALSTDAGLAEDVDHAQVFGPSASSNAVDVEADEAATTHPSVPESLYSVDAGQHFVAPGGLLSYSSTTSYLSVQTDGQESQQLQRSDHQEHALAAFGGNAAGGPAVRGHASGESAALVNAVSQNTKSFDHGMLDNTGMAMTCAMPPSCSNVIASNIHGSLARANLERCRNPVKMMSESREVESSTLPASQRTCFPVAGGDTYSTIAPAGAPLNPSEACFDDENAALLYAEDMEGVWQPSSHVEIAKVTLQDGEAMWRVPRIVQRYPSWDAFHNYLDAYSAATFQLYRVRTTYSVRSRNTRLRQLAASRGLVVRSSDSNDSASFSAESEQAGVSGLSRAHLVPERYEWYSKTFLCTHGWKRRSRGSGQRRSHTVRAAECPVKVCATLQRTEGSNTWNVVVTKHLTEHNHNLSEALYLQYSDVRRVRDPEVLAQAEQLWRGGAARRRVFELLKEQSPNQVILMKDVHNLVQRWQSQERRAGQGEQRGDCNDQVSDSRV